MSVNAPAPQPVQQRNCTTRVQSVVTTICRPPLREDLLSWMATGAVAASCYASLAIGWGSFLPGLSPVIQNPVRLTALTAATSAVGGAFLGGLIYKANLSRLATAMLAMTFVPPLGIYTGIETYKSLENGNGTTLDTWSIFADVEILHGSFVILTLFALGLGSALYKQFCQPQGAAVDPHGDQVIQLGDLEIIGRVRVVEDDSGFEYIARV